MVSTRGQLANEQLALKHAQVESIKDHQMTLKFRVSKTVKEAPPRRSARLQGTPATTSKTIISGRITKTRKAISTKAEATTKHVAQTITEIDVEEIQTVVVRRVRRTSRSLKVKLSNIRYEQLSDEIQQSDYKIIRQQKRIENYKGRYVPPPLRQYNNRYAFMFGHNPFGHSGFHGPSVQQQWHVYDLMKKDLKENFGKDCFLDQPDASTNQLQSGPMHMSDELTVDNLIKVILSISTENKLAIKQHAQLCSRFTYTVDGRQVKGSIPNYHKMRVCEPETLIKSLNIAGYQNMRQKAFHALLREIHQQNVKRLAPWEVMPAGNPTGESDFVPGLLSLDYLKGDGLSKQERFDMLVKFDLIAVKTGCCLLAFNLKIPVFVVDTHVHNMARSLGWIPEDCHDADKACMFLDKIMPDQLKFGLHQAFWHHRINCVRCMPRANPKSLAYQQRACPLESFINRDIPSLSRVTVRDEKEKAPAKVQKGTVKQRIDKKQAGSVTFLNLHSKIAEERGYVLRKVDIDDNFGDGSRQNKNQTANYYWGKKELAHVDDIIKLEDALEDIGMTRDEYEARFVKKVRGGKKKQAKLQFTKRDDENTLLDSSVDTVTAEGNGDLAIADTNEQDEADNDVDMTDAP